METTEALLEVPLEVSDGTGQKVFSAENYPGTDTVGQLIQKMVPKLRLADTRSQADRLLALGDQAIRRALSGNSERFLRASRQQGGE